MNFQAIVPLTLCILFCWSSAGFDCNFFLDPKTPPRLHNAEKRSQKLNLSSPDGWSVTVSPGGHPLAELLLPQLPQLPAERELNVELDFHAGKLEAVTNILLRLVDAGGETHSIPAIRTGNRARWKLNSGTKTPNSWGKGVNRKLDFPVRLAGIAVAFRGSEGGEILFSRLTVEDPSLRHLVPSAKTLRKFTRYTARRFAGNPAQQELTQEGLRLRFPAAGRSRINEWGILAEESLEWLQAILIQGKPLRGNARLRIRCLDPISRKWAESEFLPFPKEGGKLRLPLPAGGALQFREIEIDAEAGTELLLERMLAEQLRPAQEALEVEVETGRPGRLLLLTPESRNAFRLRLTNRSAEPLELAGEFHFRDLFGNERTFHRKIQLGAGGMEEWKPFELSGENQIWKLEYQLTAPDKMRSSGTLFFGQLAPSGTDLPANPTFRFGVCNHWVDPDSVEAMRFCGIRSVRCTTPWFDFQPQPDRWNFRLLDDKLANLEGSGIRLRNTLAYTPPWAALPPARNWRESRNRLPRLDAWRTYVETLVKRYRDRTEFYEVWNEPDLRGFADFSAEQYAELQRSAFEIIKAISPELQVASGGFATVRPEHESGKTLRFQEKALELTGKYFDIHSYHEHGAFDNYPYLLDHIFLPMRRKYNITQPWIASETATHSANGNEALQAETLFKKLIFSWSRGAIGYTWYNLVNSGNRPGYGEHNYGMLTRSFEPKFVFGVYNMITGIYREATFLRELATREEPYQFLFRTPQELLLASWNRSGEEESRLFFLGSDATAAERIDLLGNPIPAVHADGGTIYEIGRLGTTLRLKGAKQADTPRLIAELILPPNRIPGVPAPASLRLVNPWKKARTFRFMPKPAILQLPDAVTLQGGEMREFSIALADSDETELVAETEISADGWPTPLRVSGIVRRARLIPPGEIDVKRAPDFQIGRYSDLVTPWENDPATAHLVWRDARDLSAQIRLGSDGTNFLLHVEVEDDLHAPEKSPERFWNGDSVQFALAFSGQSGYFELGAAENGKLPHTGVSQVPTGFSNETVRQAMKVDVHRTGTRTTYRFRIPWKVFGANAKLLQSGVRFNLIVNDNDGERRKGWLQIAPGLGTNQTMAHSPILIFQ